MFNLRRLKSLIQTEQDLAVAGRRQNVEVLSRPVVGRASPSVAAPAIVHDAHDFQIINSTLSAAGRDVNNYTHSHHYHYQHPKNIWAILHSIPNFRQIYQDMLSKATDGTGMWLLKGDKFRLWLDPNGDIKIFWGSGIRRCSSVKHWYPL
jgi:hypothetical protein